MENIILSTYSIRITNKKEDRQVLNRFNGNDDLLDEMQWFCQFIYTNINQLKDLTGDNTIHLTLESPETRDETNRRLYGFFSSGVSGENYRIVNLKTSKKEMDVGDGHGAFRDIFFYFHMPLEKNIGYLVLQRKAKFGIKTILTKAIRAFLRKQGYKDFKFYINNYLHNSVYKEMIRLGKLKQVDIIKNRIPNNIEDYVQKGEQGTQIKGKMKTTFYGSNLPSKWKNFLDKLFKRERVNDKIESTNMDVDFEEMLFKLELDGKEKTFYVVNQHRIQPDIDVSNNIERDSNGAPKLESLINQAQELIDDLLLAKIE